MGCSSLEGKTLLVIEVYLETKGSELGVYVRLGSTNRQADRELIAELQRSVSHLYLSLL